MSVILFLTVLMLMLICLSFFCCIFYHLHISSLLLQEVHGQLCTQKALVQRIMESLKMKYSDMYSLVPVELEGQLKEVKESMQQVEVKVHETFTIRNTKTSVCGSERLNEIIMFRNVCSQIKRLQMYLTHPSGWKGGGEERSGPQAGGEAVWDPGWPEVSSEKTWTEKPRCRSCKDHSEGEEWPGWIITFFFWFFCYFQVIFHVFLSWFPPVVWCHDWINQKITTYGCVCVLSVCGTSWTCGTRVSRRWKWPCRTWRTRRRRWASLSDWWRCSSFTHSWPNRRSRGPPSSARSERLPVPAVLLSHLVWFPD